MGRDFSVNYVVVVIHFYHSTLLLMQGNGRFKNTAVDLRLQDIQTQIFEYVCVYVMKRAKMPVDRGEGENKHIMP